MQRRIIRPTTLDERLDEQAQRLRKEAQGTPPGIQRDIVWRADHSSGELPDH